MNKLIVVEQESVILNNEEVIIKSIKKDVTFFIKGTVHCLIKHIEKNKTIKINLEENGEAEIEFLLNLNQQMIKIEIQNAYHSELNLNFAATFTGQNFLEVNSTLNQSKSRNHLKIRLVESEGTLEVLALGTILEDTEEVDFAEDIKALVSNNQHIKIMPDLKVNSKNVIVSHNATISCLREEDLFYLESKGIKKEKAKELLKQGFLEGIIKHKE